VTTGRRPWPLAALAVLAAPVSACALLAGIDGPHPRPADAGGSERTPVDEEVRLGDAADAGKRDSSERHDASLEAGSCPGLKSSFMTDSRNCGGCGHDCGVDKCIGGQCPLTAVASGLARPDSIAVDSAEDVFFSELGACAGTSCVGGRVSRNVSGGKVTSTIATGLTGDTSGIPVVTDSTNVYWATSQSAGVVSSAPLAGGTPQVITPAGLGGPIAASWVALAVDDTYLYAAASGATIYLTPTASLGSPSWHTIADSTQVLAATAALNAGMVHYVFWANASDSAGSPGSGSIGGAVVSTTGIVTPLPGLTGLPAPLGASASAFGVVWVDGQQVHTLALKSTSPSVLASPGAGLEPARIVADDKGAVYWTNHDPSQASEGSVMALYHDAKTPIVLASGQTNPTALAISTYTVYWVNSGVGATDGSILSTRR
jgi:hypothetical protein